MLLQWWWWRWWWWPQPIHAPTLSTAGSEEQNSPSLTTPASFRYRTTCSTHTTTTKGVGCSEGGGVGWVGGRGGGRGRGRDGKGSRRAAGSGLGRTLLLVRSPHAGGVAVCVSHAGHGLRRSVQQCRRVRGGCMSQLKTGSHQWRRVVVVGSMPAHLAPCMGSTRGERSHPMPRAQQSACNACRTKHQ